MDLVTTRPGLSHIAEKIFSNLEKNDLLQCQEVNEYWASILRSPLFWYKRIKQNNILSALTPKKIDKNGNQLSQEHQNQWVDFCEKLSTKNMTLGLKFICEQLEDSVTLGKTYQSALVS